MMDPMFLDLEAAFGIDLSSCRPTGALLRALTEGNIPVAASNVVEDHLEEHGYQVVEELWDDSGYGGTGLVMSIARNAAGDYIGDPKVARKLCVDRGIRPEKRDPESCVCSIGFSEKEQKWYGWSHRAIYGFGIGSEVKKGDCAYVPRNFKEIADGCEGQGGDGWCKYSSTVELEPDPDSDMGALVAVPGSESVPVECTQEGCPQRYGKVGRGEWKAETLDDARQMACDFADSVS